MKTLKLAVSLFVAMVAVALCPSQGAAQQFTLTQTSLSAKITNTATTIPLASLTNITGFNTGNTTDLYIDRELMQVVSVNTTAKTAAVLRGVSGTQAAAHAASNMVLAGNPNAFINFDPSGTCSLTAPQGPTEAVPAQPTINTRTGAQWLCSTVTSTWVPGFSNGAALQPLTVTTAVASVAGTTTPSGPLFHITGTNAITAWGIPVGCNATVRGGCQFTVIPDAAFTTTATNNIATAITAVINLPIIFTWDATNSKFVSVQSK